MLQQLSRPSRRTRLFATLTSAILLALVLAVPGTLRAQINTGKITGTVLDSGGGAVPQATIRGTNLQTGVVTTAKNQESGSYVVNFLIPGQYSIEIEATGFQRSVQKG